MPTTDPPRAGTDPLRRFVLVLAALIGSVIVLYHGRDLFILFSVSGISAFLLLPLCKQLEQWRLPSWLAALLCWQVRRRQKATPRPSRAAGNTR
mgnify:CR=1 FL=1